MVVYLQCYQWKPSELHQCKSFPVLFSSKISIGRIIKNPHHISCIVYTANSRALAAPPHGSQSTAAVLLPSAARPFRPPQPREGLLTSQERCFSFKTPFQCWVSGKRPECRCKAVLQPCKTLWGRLVGAS